MDQSFIDRIAAHLLQTFGTAEVLPHITERHPEFTLEDGYAVAHRMRYLREARGERAVGRKIGGTNPATYVQTGAKGPAWNFMYDVTTHDISGKPGVCTLGTFRQPRIEAEIVLHISKAPRADMTEEEIIQCVDKVALGYEIVHSPFVDWKVPPPDSLAAFGQHQAMFVGSWHDISTDREAWVERLKDVKISMRCNDGEPLEGSGANALGSPLNALRTIVDELAMHPGWATVQPGEIITTGSLTKLMPVEPGQVWTTVADMPELAPTEVEFR